jgi:hypothetical protein
MNKRKLHHIWTRIRPVSHWYFLALAIIFGVICLTAMRNNNLTALHLRENVINTDEKNGDVEGQLRILREYVYSHMNAHLSGSSNAIYPPVQLKYRYERLVQAEKDRVSKINEKVYQEAQATCEQQFPHGLSGGGRVPCIEAYVTSHGTKEQPIQDYLYKFDFISPIWSPDLAGISMILSGLFLLLFVIRFALEKWFQYELG